MTFASQQQGSPEPPPVVQRPDDTACNGLSASELMRRGLRVVAARYYNRRRPPSTQLFESTDLKLGDESELFRDIDA